MAHLGIAHHRNIEEMANQWLTAFGLRCEEAIKFRVSYADRGDRVQLKDTWYKGGRARTVPVLEDAQRELLDRLHAFSGKDSLIRPAERYVQQMGRFERDSRRAGILKSHRLRDGYVQRRYRELAGFPCTAAGGKAVRGMSTGSRGRRSPGSSGTLASTWWRSTAAGKRGGRRRVGIRAVRRKNAPV